jgi:hypothetical protein
MILTHGRADNVVTYQTLKKQGYTGEIYFVVDDEDSQQEKYIQNFGRDRVLVFSKEEYAKKIDEADQIEDRRTITYARNACYDLAQEIGYRYFIQLDDDYSVFDYIQDEELTFKHTPVQNLDRIFEACFRFLDCSERIKTVALAQGGDFIGGKLNGMSRLKRLKRKAMNSFFCDTEKRVEFVGRMNEDVNTYVTKGSRGDIFFTIPFVMLVQGQTQGNDGGISELYRSFGTYVKSFYTVMMHPSSVKISLMGRYRNTMRLHHSISWNNTVPEILPEEYKKK